MRGRKRSGRQVLVPVFGDVAIASWSKGAGPRWDHVLLVITVAVGVTRSAPDSICSTG